MKSVFEPKAIINPGQATIPKEGHIGYVKVENYHYEGPELEAKRFSVDSYEFEDVR